MTYDRDFDDFLTTTVTWSTQATLSLAGAQTFSTLSYTIKARIEHQAKLVRNIYGDEVVSMTQVYLKPVSTTGATYAHPTLTGQLVLPSGNVPMSPQIINVLRLDDAISEGGGVHHYEVQL